MTSVLSSSKSPVQVVIAVDGGTESIRASCFNAQDGKLVGNSCAVPYTTHHPQPGWAEQDPSDWYSNLGQVVREAVDSIPNNEDCQHEICAICIDTTCCSVVVLDTNMEPLRNCLLWMDARSAPQTKQIMEMCKGDPALNVNCAGEGPLSAEWMTPKALWLRQNEPDVWEKAHTICEYQDYLNYKLTGVICASSCNAATRWHWDCEECIKTEAQDDDSLPGRPMSLYEKLGIPELARKLPRICLPAGAIVGKLTPEAAEHLHLPADLPVAQGGADAFIGMIGLGCIKPGQLCLITGSSHLHCVVSSKPSTAPGTWGAYRGAPLLGINFAEGGQSSTGSILRWVKTILFATTDDFKTLDREADSISPGSDGLLCLETFQGSRTPVTDPLARGAFVGLTLAHTRAHIWRAVMEGVCFGTRACIDALASAGHYCNEIIIAGGATKSPMWLQMHADVTGKPVVVCENTDAPLLGCAILASVAAGLHNSVEDAVKHMVRTSRTIQPNPDRTLVYDDLYHDVYAKIGPIVRVASHATVRSQSIEPEDLVVVDAVEIPAKFPVVSPSLLACDWANIRSEVQRCIEAGMSHFHVDIFDGVLIDSPHAFTFGPRMVKAIRQSCDAMPAKGIETTRAVLDLHMCVDRPWRYVEPMSQAGADRFIFQWEAIEANSDAQRIDAALSVAEQVVDAGMKCGVSINPSTDVKEIFPILESGLIDLVDVLAVEPGFGGQTFQRTALAKLAILKDWRAEKNVRLTLMVDGGINTETAPEAISAGADILVSGTFLFDHPGGIFSGSRDLLGDSSSS